MLDECKKTLAELLSPERLKEVDLWITKYPADQRQSAVMSTLRIVQEQHGSLTPDLMDAVAVYLEMPPIAVYEVASFYTMYEKTPVGRHTINVCTNISCQLCGCNKIVRALENQLGIKMGETTVDGRFTLRGVECLAACVNAPVMQIDKTYHENLKSETLAPILESYS
jgi:NADH-quinone oxidoreductase subunit E